MDIDNEQLDADEVRRETEKRTLELQFKIFQKTIGLISLLLFLIIGLFIWRLFIFDGFNNRQCGTVSIEPRTNVSNSSVSNFQEVQGRKLFLSKCASCHNPNMKSKSTGPPLGGVEERWDSKENLYKFIRNSQALIQEGHPYAKGVYKEYGSIMTAFPNLTDEEIEAILVYINYKKKNFQ